MLEQFPCGLIRKHSPSGRHRMAVCLGDQKPSVGSGFKSIADQFKWCGYERTLTLDYDGNGDILHNLNFPLPPEYHGIADAVYDGGTSEHVANIGESLTAMVRLPKVGGLICQVVPMNCYGGSYYGLDPLLLHDFYGLNGFRQLELCIMHSDTWRLRLMRLATRWLPARVVDAVRLRLKRTKRVKRFVLAEGNVKQYPPAPAYAYDEKYNQVPIFRKVHVLAVALYLGLKEKEFGNVKWPCQRDYRTDKIHE